MKFIKIFFLYSFLFFHFSIALASENVFYLLHTKPNQLNALKATLSRIENNHHAIQILIPQAYRIQKNGTVLGWVNTELLSLAKKYSIKVMPMITNDGYDKKQAHIFLSSNSAQTSAINTLVLTAKNYQFYGFQFDFEGVSVEDKVLLTKFYERAAKALHQQGFKVSFAVIPAFKTEIQDSIFLQKSYKNWSGVYDLKSLAEFSDFVTLMAYNQHPDGTIPGPTASINYAQACIKNALKEIPVKKLSLGLPTYSVYWYSGGQTSINLMEEEISFADANKIIEKNHSQVLWSNLDKVNYSIFEHHWLNRYIYLEDVKSFRAKLNLVQQYHLRGFSVFRIGTEDPRIWTVFKTSNKHFVS